MAVLEKAAEAWRLLNGVFCIYKPTGITFQSLRHRMAKKLAADLNTMQREEAPPLVKIMPPSSEDDEGEFRVTTMPDLRRHPLVVGPGYTAEDFYIQTGRGRLNEIAGVTLASIGSGSPAKIFDEITRRNPVCTYHIEGKFGLRTDDYLETGRVLEKTSFDFVTKNRLQRYLSFYQGQFQKLIYQEYGVNPNSQEAYEMHTRGLLRPGKMSRPMLYRIQCVNFHIPYFTLEVHCINETDKFLLKILNDVAEDLKTSAVCTRIRRIRFGNFTLDHALLYKYWNAVGIIEGIQECSSAVTNELRLLQEPYLTDIKDLPQVSRLKRGDSVPALPASSYHRVGVGV